jgi:hypothetical protein
MAAAKLTFLVTDAKPVVKSLKGCAGRRRFVVSNATRRRVCPLAHWKCCNATPAEVSEVGIYSNFGL